MDLHGTLDLKSNPMDSSHFENNLKHTINCPATQADRNEPSTQQGCGVRSRSRSNFEWLEPEPKTCRWWSQSHKFGFRIHRDSQLGKKIIQIKCFFLIFWTKLFWSRRQKSVDVGAGAKKFRCPELEIWLHSFGVQKTYAQTWCALVSLLTKQ